MLDITIDSMKIKNKVILQNIQLTLEKGQILGLVGENGAGKSSIMKIISGLNLQYEGQILHNKNDQLPHNNCTVFIEDPKVINYLTGLKNLKYFAMLNKHYVSEPLRRLYEAWGLPKYENKKVASYSFGTRQKLALFITLAKDANYIILDEPTNGIDSFAQAQLFEYLLYQRDQGKSILLSSHNLNEINQYCHRIVKVQGGKIVDEDYQFHKTVTLAVPKEQQPMYHQLFQVVQSYDDKIVIIYDDQFITKCYQLEQQNYSIELVATNNYFEEVK